MKRQMNELEKKLTQKSVKRLLDELAHLKYLEKHNDLMLNEGLWRQYREKVEEFKNMKQQIVNDIVTTTKQIGLLREQMDFGVEVFEKEIPTGMG